MIPLRKEIGKIKFVSFGNGGYQDACIGISFSLGNDSWGVSDFWGAWSIERSEHTKWTEESRIESLGKMVMRINQLLKDAKVESIDKLKDIPIECTFVDFNRLHSWRILTEVL